MAQVWGQRKQVHHPSDPAPSDQVGPQYSGQGDYQAARTRTWTQHVAGAAFARTEVGPVSEFHLPWDLEAPASPPDQLSRRPVSL